jgi:CheY-like chemotaxis protein
MLEDEAQDPRARQSLGRLRAAAERCARIVKTFLALARDKPRKAQPVDLHEVLDAVLDLAYGLRSAGIELQREDCTDLPSVLADEDQLNQVFLNLLVNAQQALETMPPPRRLWLRTATECGTVRVEVADNGPGVPAELRSRILEPFFTTKPVGAGTGLGLSVCHGIIASYGGNITVDDRPGGGARFMVTLPASEAVVGTMQPPPAEAKAAGAGGDVLVVDDEPEVVAMLEEALARDGHRIVTAPDGVAALEFLRDGRFSAVLCDLRMPRLDGPGLARELEAIRPDLAARLLFMTGDTLRAAAAVLPAAARGQLLEKPLDPEEIRRRVQNLVADTGTAGQVLPSPIKGSKAGTRKNGEKKRRG